MSISRRQFILGTAAGLILPSYYERVFSYFENHGEPLLEIPKQARIDLYAHTWASRWVWGLGSRTVSASRSASGWGSASASGSACRTAGRARI